MLVLGIVSLVVALVGITLDAQTPLERLRLQIEEAITPARGDVGVFIKHLESGVELGVRADEPFPMASVVKVPILVELFAQERGGRIKLDEMYTLKPHDQHVGSGDISPNFDLPGLAMSLRNLANLMMIVSDNSATDILVSRLGAANVTARMRTLGINGVRVDRTTQELILDYGEQDTEKLKHMLLADLRLLIRRPYENEAERLVRDTRYADDPRDQSTPRDMARLMEMMWKGQLVDEAASKDMLEIMKRCRTGNTRIKGLLPRGTVVAHKTGSVGGTIDDVGLVYLPHGAGHVAVSAFSKRTSAASEDVERVIAEISRYAYDYFLFTAPATSPSAAR